MTDSTKIEYSDYDVPPQSANAAIALLDNTKNKRGEPIWWVVQRLPGRPPDEQYACLIEDVHEHIHGATLPAAIYSAYLEWQTKGA